MNPPGMTPLAPSEKGRTDGPEATIVPNEGTPGRNETGSGLAEHRTRAGRLINGHGKGSVYGVADK